MVTHLVLMKPRAGLAPADRDAFVDAFERALREITEIRAVRIGRRVMFGAGYESAAPDMEYVAMIDFEDLASLQAYLRHPAHQELGSRFGMSLSGALVYDFEECRLEDVRGERAG
jgi:hypothetical protein